MQDPTRKTSQESSTQEGSKPDHTSSVKDRARLFSQTPKPKRKPKSPGSVGKLDFEKILNQFSPQKTEDPRSPRHIGQLDRSTNERQFSHLFGSEQQHFREELAHHRVVLTPKQLEQKRLTRIEEALRNRIEQNITQENFELPKDEDITPEYVHDCLMEFIDFASVITPEAMMEHENLQSHCFDLSSRIVLILGIKPLAGVRLFLNLMRSPQCSEREAKCHELCTTMLRKYCTGLRQLLFILHIDKYSHNPAWNTVGGFIFRSAPTTIQNLRELLDDRFNIKSRNALWYFSPAPGQNEPQPQPISNNTTPDIDPSIPDVSSEEQECDEAFIDPRFLINNIDVVFTVIEEKIGAALAKSDWYKFWIRPKETEGIYQDLENQLEQAKYGEGADITGAVQDVRDFLNLDAEPLHENTDRTPPPINLMLPLNTTPNI